MKLRALITFWGAMVFAQPLMAAPPVCNAGSEGTIVYNKDYKLVQFCEGTQWIGLTAKIGGEGDTLSDLSCQTNEGPVWDGSAWTCGAGSSVWLNGGSGKIYYSLGNVGIGITNPVARLHVNGGSALFNTNTNAAPLKIARANGPSEVLNIGIEDITARVHYVNDEATSSLIFRLENTDTESGGGANANNNEVMTLVGDIAGGRVGIGTTAPTTALTVNGTATATAFAGSGASLTNLNASNLASGTVATARLGSGTANNTTYLRGDGTWQTVSGGGDNLGNHTATTNIQLGTNWLSRDGTSKGLSINTDGALTALRSAGASSAIVASFTDGTQWLRHNPNSNAGSWTPLAQAGDHVISYSNGTIDTGALVIAQWSGSSRGLRIDATGGVTAGSFAGAGSGLTNLNASNLASGTVATARLGSGTANSSVFLRGDGTWAAPSLSETDPEVGTLVNGNACIAVSGKVECSDANIGTKDDITTRTPSGFWQTNTATIAEGWPQDSNGWYHLLSTTHSNTGNYYAMQFAGNFGTNNDVFYRTTSNNGAKAWNRLWHDGNDGSGSGLDGDLLDGQDSAFYRNAGNLNAGTVATARLGSGTANSTTYLRGDGTWQAVSGADNLGNHIATTVVRSDTHNTDDLGTTAIRWKDGWFAGTVTGGTFAGSGASLTSLPAANLTGALPAISGANLTSLNATNLGSGTVAAARMPALTGDVTMAAGTTVTNIAANAVGTAEIADGSVTAADTAFVGTLTEGKWCSVSGGKIVCTSDAPGGGSMPSGCLLEGARCDDGSILAGVVANNVFFVTDVNQSTSTVWASVNQANSGSQSLTDGKANQAWIVANRTLSQYPAFQLCENLNRHGHTDWYLPSKDELNVLYQNRTAIGGFGTGYFWSSSESGNNNAWGQNFSDGSLYTNFKSSGRGVRCVRRA